MGAEPSGTEAKYLTLMWSVQRTNFPHNRSPTSSHTLDWRRFIWTPFHREFIGLVHDTWEGSPIPHLGFAQQAQVTSVKLKNSPTPPRIFKASSACSIIFVPHRAHCLLLVLQSCRGWQKHCNFLFYYLKLLAHFPGISPLLATYRTF